MPIVNGTFVPDTLGSPKAAQQQVFGEYNKKDMADYTQAAYNFLQKQQEQAFTLDMWNLTNQYNSPAAQMQRYQDAGLNPNLIYSQQNTASQPGTPSAAQFRSSGNYNKSQQLKLEKFQTGMQAIGQIMQTVDSARKMYDYVNYGAETSRWNMIGAQESALGQKLSNAWQDYLLHGENMIYGDASRLPSGPAATRYTEQTGLIHNQSLTAQENYQRLLYLVQEIMPQNKEAQESLKKLRDQQFEIMDGKFGAISSLDFGLGETFNQWARMFMFIALAQMF